MDFLIGGLSTAGEWLIPFFFVLSIVVFFHELGHFLVARWNGVGVAKFAVGFGPDLFKFTDKHGTIWAFSAIPLGGYVKFIDDADPSGAKPSDAAMEQNGLDPEKMFAKKKLWQRAAVVAAGPIANFILAIVILSCLFFVNGRNYLLPVISELVEGGAAETAGFEPGDFVLEIDGVGVKSFNDLQRIVTVNADIPLVFKVRRNEETLTIPVTPDLREIDDGFGGTQRVGLIGVRRTNAQGDFETETFGPIGAVREGVAETGYIIARTITFLGGIITGRESIDQLGGPVRIADVSQRVAKVSFSALITLTAVLSVSIGIMNLLPIPVLDGGHLVLYAVEAVKGSPVSKKVQGYCFKFGFVLLMTMFVVVTSLDILRLIS